MMGLGLAALSWLVLCCNAYSAGMSLQKQTSVCMCRAGRSSVSSSGGVLV